MKSLRAFLGAFVITAACLVGGCGADVSESGSVEPASSAVAAAPTTATALKGGDPATQGGASCLSKCMAENAGDPYAASNCQCICNGKPGKTCWLE